MANKIGCQAGRTKIVDPNAFDGQSSSNNVSVGLEDLNISVVLETSKKGRTLLSASSDKSNMGNIESSKTVEINFIDGANINGKKVLTTNYTDLTTIFDDNGTRSSEGLGITSIDIDFNSQIAPMITINFIDVRGSAIFQNEGNLKNGKNKYSTFFELPYPMFKLTVKGYYGRPVQYCLHLTKFNSKFNSKTGNFEITCNFIGYTYAMLSDMLIGYLKAIPYTKIGGERYDIINAARLSFGLDTILNLNDLMIAISTINQNLDKIAATNPNANQISIIDKKYDELLNIEGILQKLAFSLDMRTDMLDRYDYIIKPITLVKKVSEKVDEYKIDITKAVNAFNLDSLVFLNLDLFTPLSSLSNVNLDYFINLNKSDINKDNNKYSNFINYTSDGNNDVNLGSSYFDVWDLTAIYDDIDKAKVNLDINTKDNKEKLALAVKNEIKKSIGFDPTVRNIVEIFTTAVEVFMESIYSVSLNAEKDSDNKRRKQLLSKFKEGLNSDVKESNLFPWPDYREDIDLKGYKEKYLGARGVLEKPLDVNELSFIDDLLKAFIIAANKTDIANSIISNTETNWFPINPIDTRIFGISDSPYVRLTNMGLTNFNPIVNLMLIRGMTFLGYNNIYLTKLEIENMAEIEANSIITYVLDDKIKQGLSMIDLDYIKNLNGEINDEKRKIIQKSTGNNYYYTYFPKSTSLDDFKILPINEGFEGTWVKDKNNQWKYSDSIDGNTKFLTNYNNNKNINKIDDGGVYVIIMNKKTYEENSTLSLPTSPTTVDITKNKLILEKISVSGFTDSSAVEKAGYNVFGGIYGIQEFTKLDYGNGLELPLRYVFFSENSLVGLCYSDINSKPVSKKWDYGSDDKNTTIVYDNSYLYAQYDTTKSTITGGIRWGRFENEYSNIGKNWVNFNELNTNNVTYPFIDQQYQESRLLFGEGPAKSVFSLFGSRWFYGQSLSKYPLYSKALLFLNTLPWNGEPFEKNEIKHLFDIRAGFVHAPKLWCAYIGGLLWRMDKTNPIFDESNNIIGGGSGLVDPIIWKTNVTNDVLIPYKKNSKSSFVAPTRTQKINKLFVDVSDDMKFEEISYVIQYLPQQVKNQLKSIFFSFVNLNSIDNNDSLYDFNKLNNEIQIITDGTLTNFDKATKKVIDAYYDVSVTSRGRIPTNIIKNNFINIDKYKLFLPDIENIYYDKQIALEFKDGFVNKKNSVITPVNIIITMLTEEVVIANTSNTTWLPTTNTTKNYAPIYSNVVNFDMYFNKLLSVIKDKINLKNTVEEKKIKEQEIFGTQDEDIIKLQLYRNCKNTYDKWLGGVSDIKNIIFQCGQKRSSVDIGLAKKYRKNDEPRLIDSFRFVDRAFNDIGDKLYINPTFVNEYLINSPNTSFYDAVGGLLASNNFNFLALPTFINYNSPEVLESMFEPYPNYEKAIEDGICGPSFVSVYIGQSSKHLDIYDSEYTNDGIEFVCSGNDNKNLTGIPKDFIGTSNDYENDVAIFSVNYGQQNQNIFKDVTLDQSEFTETDESLQITDNLASKANENNLTLGGQNIYNVYGVRSYKAEVEMMGNAMIQPMMHFQLNNIPMFHGGYLITRVKHSIVPNHMSTSFTGVRIRFPSPNLLDGSDFYMNMIDSMKFSDGTSTGNASNATNFITKYVIDLNYNIPSDKIIEGSVIPKPDKITKTAEAEIVNWENGKLNEKNGLIFLDKYSKTTPGPSSNEYSSNAQPWSAVFISYIMVSGDDNFAKSPAHYNYITAAMNGKNGYEAFPLKSKLKIKGEIGDLFCTSRSGGYTASHCDVLYKLNGNIASLVGGNLSDSVRIKNITLTDGYTIDSTDIGEYKIVIKKTNNKYYKNKKLIGTGNYEEASGKLETGSGADYWSLVAISALENDTPQGRCDVAQSIYNRLLSKKYSKLTIKELIVANKQYEPVGRAKNEFLAIKNKETAIIAYQKSKKVSYEKAKTQIEETGVALNDTTLVNNSKSFIMGRTDFYSSSIKNRIPVNGREGLVERDKQIFGWFVGPSAIAYGKKNPPTASKPDFSNIA